MKLKLFSIAAMLVACAATGFAQNDEENPNNWFIQGGLGASWSNIKGTGFGEAISPAGEIAVGKQFMPQLSARVAIGGWKGRYHDYRGDHGLYRAQATLDGVWNLSQTYKVNPTRPVDLNFILGVGFARNYTLNVSSLVARAGLGMDIRLCRAWAANVEATFNGVSSHWYQRCGEGFGNFVNVIVGATYKFGTGYKCPSCRPTFDNCKINAARVDTVEVIKEVTNTVYVEKDPIVETVNVHGMVSHVVFELASTKIQTSQEMNIAAIAQYMQENPDSKCTVVGYADKGTGTVAINLRLAKERAEIVANQLVNKYGINRDRLDVQYMQNQETEQPFKINDWNRVVIMTAD